MGLMTNLRRNMHIILWALIIVFVLSMTIGGLVGGANIMDIISGKSKLQGIAGIVNGKKLDATRFSELIQTELSNIREKGQEIDDITVDRISDQIWNRFVTETLVIEEIERLGLQATDNEIYDILINNPPKFLIENEVFQTDGKFDHQKYLDRFHNPQGDEWFGVEQYIGATIPFEKIRILIQSQAMVSDKEILSEYTTSNVNFDVETLTFPFSIVKNDSFPITDEEISSYYYENKEKFFVEETRILNYIFLDIKPTSSDSMSVYQLAMNLKNRIENGESFETVATEYTEDPSGVKSGGDLGWFGKGQMVPAFERAAFSVKIGEITDPVLTRFGYHIIKIEDKRNKNGEKQVKASHILLKIKPGPETLEHIRSKSNLFAFDANEYGFAAAADTHNLKIQTSSPIKEKSKYVSGIGHFPQAARFAFSNKPLGSISEVLSTENGYVILKLDSINVASYKSIDNVKDQIKPSLLKTKRTEKLTKIANEFYNELDENQSLEFVVKTNPKLKYTKHESVTLNKPLKGLSRSNLLTGTILALKSGQISKPISIGNQMVIVKLLSRADIDEEKYKVEKEVIRDKLLTRKKTSIYNNWTKELEKNAEIIDNREKMYN